MTKEPATDWPPASVAVSDDVELEGVGVLETLIVSKTAMPSMPVVAVTLPEFWMSPVSVDHVAADRDVRRRWSRRP